jgi:hypothetical protein
MSNTTAAPPKNHVNSEPGLRHPFLSNWTVGDVVVLMGTSTMFVVMLSSLSFIYTLSFGLPLLAFNLRWQYGRVWWELYCALFVDAYIFFGLGDTLYLASSEDDSGAVRRFLRQKRYRRPKNRYVWPIKHTVVEAQGERYGIIQQLDRPFDHIPVRGRGSDVSAFNHDRQHEESNRLAYNIDQVAATAAEDGLKMGMSYVRLTRPSNSFKAETYFALNGQPLVFDTNRFVVDDKMAATMARLRKNADQITAAQRANGAAETWQLAVATIKRTGEMEKAAQGKLDDPRLYDLPLIELGRQVVDAISGTGMRVRDVHCLGYLELCQLIRGSYDVTNLSFHDSRYGDNIELVTEEDAADPNSPYGPEDIGTLKDPFPVAPHQSIVVGNDFICLDGNWISTLLVTRRREIFHVSEVQEVYHYRAPRGIWSSAVSAGQTISGSMATNVLVYQQRATSGIRRGLFGGPQPIEHPNARKRRQSLSQQAELLSQSSLAQQFNDVLAVAAPSREAMVKGRSQLLGTFRNNGYKCRVIRGRSRQLDAAITGTLGIHRL